MHFNYLFLIPLLCGVFADRNSVPVFVMDNENVTRPAASTNPFSALSAPEFMELIQQVKKRSTSVVVFVEHEFCAEDISAKDAMGSPFYHLHKGLTEQKVKYFPLVTNPSELLNKAFRPNVYNTFNLKQQTTKLPIYDNHYKYFYVFFEDGVNETRIEALRRHDSIINEVLLVLRQFHAGPVSAFYTGRMNPMLSKLGHAPFSTTSSRKKEISASYMQVTFYDLIHLKSGKRWPMNHQIKTVPKLDKRAKETVSVTLHVSTFYVRFNFKYQPKKWNLETIELLEGPRDPDPPPQYDDEGDLKPAPPAKYELVGSRRTEIGAPFNVSFLCDEPVQIQNKRDSSIVILTKYQIELVHEWVFVRKGGGHKFNRAVNCAPFFSAAIVTFLFLSFLLLGILFYGIISMMSCVSNDRYDDPRGKPLIIHEATH